MKFADKNSNINPLIIPFNILALYCSDYTPIAKPNADFSKVSYFDKKNERVIKPNLPYISENLVSQPFEADQYMNIEDGLHLHFILPQFLRSSIPIGKPDNFQFESPAIPNRWLVFKNAGNENSKIFLIESDYCYPEYKKMRNKVTFPIPFNRREEKNLNVPFRYMGRQIELDKNDIKKTLDVNEVPPSNGEYWYDIVGLPLTAVGYGDPAFTGSFPNCKDILTFHDANVEDGDNYDVIGFYDLGNATQETIKKYIHFFQDRKFNEADEDEQTSPLEKLKAELKNYWSISFETDAEIHINQINELLLFSRITVTNKRQFKPKKDNKGFNLSVGNNGTEAIAAYFSNTLKKPQLENKLEAIQFESLRNGSVDLGVKFQEARHHTGFIPESGGICYTLDFSIENDKTTPNPNNGVIAGMGEDKDSEANRALRLLMKEKDLKEQLRAINQILFRLNNFQSEFDKKTFQIQQKRQQLFADWYKYMLSAHPPYQKDTEYPKADDVLQFLLRSINDSLSPLVNETGFLTVDPETTTPTLIDPSNINASAAASGKKFKDSVAFKIVAIHKNCSSSLSILNKQIKKLINNKLKKLDKAKLDLGTKQSDLKQTMEELKILIQNEEAPKAQITKLRKKEAKLKLEQYRLEQAIKPLEIFNALRPKTITYHLNSEPSERYYRPIEPVVMIAQNKKKPNVFENNKNNDWHTIYADKMKSSDIFSGKFIQNALWKNIIDQTQNANEKPYDSQWLLMDWMLDYRPTFDPSITKDGYEKDFVFKMYDIREDTPDFTPFTNKDIELSDIPRSYRGRTILSVGSPDVLEEKIMNFLGNQEKVETESHKVLLKNHPDLLEKFKNLPKVHEDLLKVLVQLRKQDIMTQSMGGLNESLLMRKQTMQLDVSDPIAFQHYKPVIEMIRNWIGDERISAPEPTHFFNPIRAGVMLIKKLKLIDTFGLEKTIYDADKVANGEEGIYKSGTLKLPPNIKIPDRYSNQKKHMLHAPPRFSQAAKLHLEWKGATEVINDEIQDDYDPNPICGWMMPNFLENTLQVFNQYGDLLGAIGVDGLIPKPGASQFQLADIDNEHLRNFVCFFYQLSPPDPDSEESILTENKRSVSVSFFNSFLEEIEEALDFIEPQNYRQNSQLSVLTGRPLAIVRMSLNLEVKGEYAVNQDWNIFKRDLYRDVRNYQRSTYHFENVEIPLRIGDFHQMNDGVVGFWYRNLKAGKEESSENLTGYTSFNPHSINPADTFYMPLNDTGISNKLGRKKTNDQSFLIGQRLNEAPQIITMLFDPRGKVNVASGLLPVKSKEIPEKYFKDVLERLRVHFQVAPMISPFNDLQLPLPNMIDKEWVWLSVDKFQTVTEIPTAPTISKSLFNRMYTNKIKQMHRQLWIAFIEAGWIVFESEKEREDENESENQTNKARLVQELNDKPLPQPYSFFQHEIIALLEPDEQKFLHQSTIEAKYNSLLDEKIEEVWDHLTISKRIKPIDVTRAFINFDSNEHEELPEHIDPKIINDIFIAQQDGLSDPSIEPLHLQMSIQEGWVKFA